ncbi:MAG: dockerin type I repeat-containing protein [Oscillospiraceae bacterium]|nr:dockerin type I repeat-containing protein [Oscillospiraceae bacterium]
MKRRLYAACASVLMLAMLPLNGLSAFAEAISPDAPVPDWVPTDFLSAMEFRNTYGATHIADDRICIVERQETREGYTYSEEITSTGEMDAPYGKYRDVIYDTIKLPEQPAEGTKEYFEYESQYRGVKNLMYDEKNDCYIPGWQYHVTVYEMQPNTTLTITQKLKKDDQERDGVVFEFSKDGEGKITEDDLLSWVPDCIAEYTDFEKTTNAVSLHDNYIVYCDSVNFSTGLSLDISITGTARLQCIYSDNIQVEELEMPTGSADRLIRVYRALNNGLVKLSAVTMRKFGASPEEQEKKEEAEYFGVETPEKIGIIDPGQFTEPVAGDCNGDGEFTIADAVMLNKYLLGSGELYFWTLADLDEDNVVNAADLSLMKRKLRASVLEQDEAPKLQFKGEQEHSWYTFQSNSTIEFPYHFYITVPTEFTQGRCKIEFKLFNAENDEEIKYESVKGTGKENRFDMTVNMEIVDSEKRSYYTVVTITELTAGKPGEPQNYQSDVFEWNVEVSHDIPAPPAAVPQS